MRPATCASCAHGNGEEALNTHTHTKTTTTKTTTATANHKPNRIGFFILAIKDVFAIDRLTRSLSILRIYDGDYDDDQQ